ncbi:MAG: PAS domain-containing protein, partial [Rhodospirillaceae bacterium]|nr:PAS domain-containing protein [Rhodospirillaceae bacterium]
AVTGGINPPTRKETPASGSLISKNAVREEIRIVQSVQTQRNMPVLLFGNTTAVAIVVYTDWAVAIANYAIYFLAAVLLLLLPVVRSYLHLLGLPRPTRVSQRRIRLIIVHSFLLGLAWAVSFYLMISNVVTVDGIVLLMVMFFLGFGAAALMPSLPLVAIAYFAPMLLAAVVAALLNDILRWDLLAFVSIAGAGAIARSAWQSWRETTASVQLGLEKIKAEAEVHQRETEAMRSMLAAIPFPLVLTRETGALEASETASRQFGIPAGSVGGISIRDFFVNPDDQDVMADLQAEQGRLEEYEVQFKNAQGEPFWALLSSLPLRYEDEDCWLNAIYVIDDRKRAEAETLEAKQRAEETSQTLEAVSGQLSKYISPQLYSSIFSGEQKVEIESKRKKLTIFFSDIVSFTAITDQLESEELTALLNQYLTEMSKIAQEHGAYFDKFIGDAMMFYFGDSESKGVREDAAACVRMAIVMQRRLADLQHGWRAQGLIDRPFEARMGINTGYCTVGNFGNEDRMDYTIIGGEVNLAARLEANADAGGILIAAETYSLVRDWLLAEEREAITMKGFAKPVKTFSVKGIYDELAMEGRVIHSELDGLSLTIDCDRLNQSSKKEVVHKLKDALAQLEN